MSKKKNGSDPYRQGCSSNDSSQRRQASRKSGMTSAKSHFSSPLMLRSEARRFKSIVL